MQAIRNRWLAKRQEQMAKWLNGFKPKPPQKKRHAGVGTVRGRNPSNDGDNRK